MAYAFVMFSCVACGGMDVGNPHKVPSIRVSRGPDGRLRPDDDGDREPLCRRCVLEANQRAVARGEEPFVIPDGAYEPAGFEID